jgi:hypothetical protein
MKKRKLKETLKKAHAKFDEQAVLLSEHDAAFSRRLPSASDDLVAYVQRFNRDWAGRIYDPLALQYQIEHDLKRPVKITAEWGVFGLKVDIKITP